ncbi:MAG: dihydropteroate synthase [Opitutales bacterium]|nr:dihydropteroate synthase [Opitutales bacterium]
MPGKFKKIAEAALRERRTLLMGIVNATPDSFSDGGEFLNPRAAARHACELVEQGADLIDLGAESTRPGSRPVDETEELSRLLPALRAIREVLPDVPVSIDTYRPNVARAAIAEGASLINDVCAIGAADLSRERDYPMARVVAEAGATLIAMHNRFGNADYGNEFMGELCRDLLAGTERILAAGVPAESLWLDPGFGFGKSVEQNLQMVAQMNKITALGFPVLLGTSRKSALGAILGKVPKERGGGDAACAAVGIAGGVAMLRLHDVVAVRDLVIVADALRRTA